MTEDEHQEGTQAQSGSDVLARSRASLVDAVVNPPDGRLSELTDLPPNLVTPLAMTETYEALHDILKEYADRYEEWMAKHREHLAARETIYRAYNDERNKRLTDFYVGHLKDPVPEEEPQPEPKSLSFGQKVKRWVGGGKAKVIKPKVDPEVVRRTLTFRLTEGEGEQERERVASVLLTEDQYQAYLTWDRSCVDEDGNHALAIIPRRMTEEEIAAERDWEQETQILLTEVYRKSYYQHRRSVKGRQRDMTVDLAKEEMAAEAGLEEPADPDMDD